MMINYFMYMDDVKIFVKKGKELEIHIHTTIYTKDIGMEFWDWKMCLADNEEGKKKQQKEQNYKIKKMSEHFVKKKITITWEYWKEDPSNWDERKSKKGVPHENTKPSWN